MIRLLATTAFWTVLAVAVGAHADLGGAWQAHEDLDFLRAIEIARETISSGEASREELASAYFLIGRCEASLRRTDESREAFVRALALDPDLRLDPHSSPVEQSPFMEARGFWLEHAGRLELSQTEGASSWVVHVTDPASLADRLLVFGDDPATPLGERDVADDDTLELPYGLPTHRVALVDASGNLLVELSLPQPRAHHSASTDPARQQPAGPPKARSWRDRLRLAGYLQLGLAAVTGAVGVAMHMRRERLVDRWNGPECEQPSGRTRGGQCAQLIPQIERAENAAIGLYAGAGVALISGLVSVGISTRGQGGRERQVACATASLGAVCRATF